jgi:cysteine-rich repeat protein
VPTTTAAPNIDHYKCYKARTAPGAAGFVQQQLALDDAFESKLTDVIKTDSFCDPVDVNGQGINDPSAQLQCYKIRDAAGQQTFASRDLTADDEFGVRPLTAKKAKLLCVPSTRDGQPSALHIDHFKCYTAKSPSGSPKFTEQQRTLTDAFESKLMRVIGPETVCNAVAANGGPVLSPAAQLHCYKIKDAANQPRFARTTVAAANDLASEQLSVQKSHLVCVPSTRPAAPACGDGFLDPGEQCDDGNTHNGDGCNSSCMLESCGNGVVDGGEQCDHGAANGTDDCCSATCQLVDPDGDGICNRDDVCPADADNDSDGDGFCIGLAFHAPKVGGGDPCSRPAGTGTWVKPKVVFTKLVAPSGDEKLSIKGAFIIPTGGPTLALDLYGIHIRILDAQKNLVLDEHIPGGAYLSSGQPIGWKVAGTPPTKWNYLDKVNKPPLHNGINKVTIANKSNSVPGLVTVVLKAVTATYTLSPGQEPLTVTLELNDQALPAGSLPGTDQCGEVVFGVPPAVPACVFSGGPTNDAKLSCK